MKNLLIIFFLLITKLSVSQEKLNYQINIFTNGGMGASKMNIDIMREPDTIKIYYARVVGRDTIEQNKDKEKNLILFNEIDSQMAPENRSKKLMEFSRLNEEYEIYKKDSLIIEVSNHPLYASLIDSIYSVDKEELENKEYNKNWIVLDGTHFSIDVNVNNETIKTVWVHSPSNKSHPLISRLIRKTLNLYREKNPNSFLKMKYTGNY